MIEFILTQYKNKKDSSLILRGVLSMEISLLFTSGEFLYCVNGNLKFSPVEKFYIVSMGIQS